MLDSVIQGKPLAQYALYTMQYLLNKSNDAYMSVYVAKALLQLAGRWYFLRACGAVGGRISKCPSRCLL